MECSAKIYLRQCKCILYYMPRFEDDIVICGRQNDACVADVTNKMNARKNSSFACHCLPGCVEVNYDADISMAPLLRGAPILQKRKGLLEPNVSVAHIFYKKNFFRSQKKDELIGFTEFLCKFDFHQFVILLIRIFFLFFGFGIISANTGGLLGLFMGFSVFSIVEVLYFLSLRPYSNHMKLKGRKRKTINRMFKKVRRFRSRQILTPLEIPQIENTAGYSTSHSIYP